MLVPYKQNCPQTKKNCCYILMHTKATNKHVNTNKSNAQSIKNANVEITERMITLCHTLNLKYHAQLAEVRPI